MSFTFNKHNPKSFVVRGDIIDNLKTRQQLISKLSGKCVYNTRLKLGSGLLVPINETNEQVLNNFKLEYSKSLKEPLLTISNETNNNEEHKSQQNKE